MHPLFLIESTNNKIKQAEFRNNMKLYVDKVWWHEFPVKLTWGLRKPLYQVICDVTYNKSEGYFTRGFLKNFCEADAQAAAQVDYDNQEYAHRKLIELANLQSQEYNRLVIHDLLKRDKEKNIVIGERLIITAVAYQCLEKFYKDF